MSRCDQVLYPILIWGVTAGLFIYYADDHKNCPYPWYGWTRLGFTSTHLFFKMVTWIPDTHLCLRGLMFITACLSMIGYVSLTMPIYILNHVDDTYPDGCIDLWTDIFDGMFIGAMT